MNKILLKQQIPFAPVYTFNKALPLLVISIILLNLFLRVFAGFIREIYNQVFEKSRFLDFLKYKDLRDIGNLYISLISILTNRFPYFPFTHNYNN
tara:strand:- start:11262 stop:11546 length:285 start_codon:yes stop_codon:yes gene_type:complete